ncbi:MAG: molybdopterin cofactor-binding domain-containing protein, partial [Vicinamibacterales bacterium]
SHVPEGAMRGVGYSMTGFIAQGFVDELARAAGRDPYRFQRALLDPAHTPVHVPDGELDPDMPPAERASRLRAVLDEAAVRSDWGTPLGAGRGRGLAIQEQQGAYYALVAEVTLDGRGWFSVDRVVVVGDVGRVAHPDNARAQVEGSVAFGLSSALFGEITIRNGRVEQSNFHDYRVLRMGDMPPVDTHWIGERTFWGDASQAVIGIVAPAVANAIYDAGGPRIRALPFKNHAIVPRA